MSLAGWDGENAKLPLNMLDKLLIEVRRPEEGFDLDDFAWADTRSVSAWRNGWNMLRDAGYVETQVAEDPDDDDLLNAFLCVKFTPAGLKLALSRIVSDKAVEANILEEAAISVERYDESTKWGMF